MFGKDIGKRMKRIGNAALSEVVFKMHSNAYINAMQFIVFYFINPFFIVFIPLLGTSYWRMSFFLLFVFVLSCLSEGKE